MTDNDDHCEHGWTWGQCCPKPWPSADRTAFTHGLELLDDPAILVAPLSEGEVATALKIIEDSRRTHVEWVDYLSKFGADLRPHEEIAGDAAHHREAVEGYDLVLRVLRSLAATPLSEGEAVPEGWTVEWRNEYRKGEFWGRHPILVPSPPPGDKENPDV